MHGIAMLLAEDTALDLLQRCGITATVKLSSSIAHYCFRVVNPFTFSDTVTPTKMVPYGGQVTHDQGIHCSGTL